MTEPNELLMLAVIILFVAGFTTMMFGAKEMSGKIALSGILIMVLGVVFFLHPFWSSWYLFFKNAVLTIPTWAWFVIGIWIYLNAGWRFAEYKLRVATRWQTTNPMLLHILWPVNVCDNNITTDPQGRCDLSDNQYKSWSTVCLVAELALKLLVIVILWLIWLATMCHFKPIHPEIWKTYHNGI